MASRQAASSLSDTSMHSSIGGFCEAGFTSAADPRCDSGCGWEESENASAPVTGIMTGLAGQLKSTDFGGLEKGLETARLTIRTKSTAAIREKRFLDIWFSSDRLNLRHSIVRAGHLMLSL